MSITASRIPLAFAIIAATSTLSAILCHHLSQKNKKKVSPTGSSGVGGFNHKKDSSNSSGNETTKTNEEQLHHHTTVNHHHITNPIVQVKTIAEDHQHGNNTDNTNTTCSSSSTAVVICTSQGHKIEGTIIATKEQDITDNCTLVITSAPQVNDETKVLTFAMPPDLTTTTAAVSSSSTPATLDNKTSDKERPSVVPDAKPTTAVGPEKEGQLYHKQQQLKLQQQYQLQQQKQKQKAIWVAKQRRFDSEAVIMISPEDMAMMAQMMEQLDDDKEFFDCGDDDREYRAVAKKRITWKQIAS